MVPHSRYQTRPSAAGTGLASGACVLSGDRKACAECFNWAVQEDSLEKKDGDGSEDGIRRYEERVSPRTVKSSTEVRNLKRAFFDLIGAMFIYH